MKAVKGGTRVLAVLDFLFVAHCNHLTLVQHAEPVSDLESESCKGTEMGTGVVGTGAAGCRPARPGRSS